ncbi:AI-2E family transporter [Chelativorans sp. Marseille-P2723]|uniref:AI-2E family transporter n=1 Tax=Chelativorans sp. Marseille-P2723 TaxID=2709133 RepID=UPI00156D7A08|nr:AI-2E family transporter [Chelativorans sp. Marseille-P2723]
MAGQEVGGKDEFSSTRTSTWLLAIIAAILLVFFLRETAWVSGTLALAFFAAMALWPVDFWIQQHVPRGLRWIGHAAALMIIILVFLLFGLGLLFVVTQVAIGLERYEEPLAQMLETGSRWGQSLVNGTTGTISPDRLIETVMTLATTIAQSVWSFGGILTLLFFLVWLMLLETLAYEQKLEDAASSGNGAALLRVVSTTAMRFRRYLAVRTIMGVSTGLLYMAWIWWWNLDFVLVWGLLAFLLNYIPTIGSIIAGALPVGLAFLQRDLASAFVIAGGLIVIEQLMGNYVDPKLQGRQLSLSPLAVLIALMFWTWVWGLIGALLAVPMMLVMTLAFARVPALRPIALAFSNATNMQELEAATAP